MGYRPGGLPHLGGDAATDCGDLDDGVGVHRHHPLGGHDQGLRPLLGESHGGAVLVDPAGEHRRAEQRLRQVAPGQPVSHYRALQDQLHQLGFIASDSVTERYTVCASRGCRCHADPAVRHGLYLQHTRKTVTRRLTAEQAERYREQIANRRLLDQLITEMEQISTQARELPPAEPR